MRIMYFLSRSLLDSNIVLPSLEYFIESKKYGISFSLKKNTSYCGILIFQTSKGNENLFKKRLAREIGGQKLQCSTGGRETG